jgi:hypothetical protein
MPRKKAQQGIFVSYRRTGARADAGRLYDRLSRQFGDDHVFMDIDDILPGQNFQDVLRDTLANCQVLLVLIGPKWLDTKDADGLQRLQDEQDFVRMEVQSAIQRRLPIIPILINRARMPSRDDLPKGIDSLADHQALEISDKRFHEDVDDLIRALERILSGGDEPWYLQLRHGAIFGAIAVVLAAMLLWFGAQKWFASSGGIGSRPKIPLALDQPSELSYLRRESTILSSAELYNMLIKRNFFDSALNPDGTGQEHHYELEISESDSVVIDHSTDLMWQQSGMGRAIPVGNAGSAIASLNTRKFAGHDDWRLPTMEELMSLLARAKAPSAHMSRVLSPQEAPIVWSVDRAADRSFWVVYAFSGTAALESEKFNAWVRAVRTVK